MKTSFVKINTLLAVFVASFAFAQQQKTANTTTKSGTELSIAEKKKALEQEKSKLIKPYHPEESAEEKINALIEKAKKENKRIMIQAGGNWCIWCLRFNQFVQDTPELKGIVDENYLYYHLNWSPENKNEEVFARYRNPGEEYGYPVFIVLDKNGKMIHVQESSGLEEGKSYSVDRVKEFFLKWAGNND